MDNVALYRDAQQPLEKRVEDLLSRMTLAEKIGQLNMPLTSMRKWLTPEAMINDATDAERFVLGTHMPQIGPGGGFFGLTETNPIFVGKDSAHQAEEHNRFQRLAVEETRLGIPLLQGGEGAHGLVATGTTIFPEGPAQGSTWNPSLLQSLYSAEAREARALGQHMLATLVIEPIRDPRLGRNCEAFSEDTYLTARIAEAIVRGMQGGDVSRDDKVVVMLCHYPGQSQPLGGLERGAMEVSERSIRQVFLPPWVAGIQREKALAVEATYPAIDDVPAHASEFYLRQVLRDELGFSGIVVSEGWGFQTLVYEGLAATQADAGCLALRAGVDLSITFEPAYLWPLVDAVETGRVPLALVDRAVRRVLALKFRLGLFERPYVDPAHAAAVVHCAEHQRLALQAAREGIVLLKNEHGVLPLRKDLRSIAVIGPNAHDPVNQLGDYTLYDQQPIVTILDGIKAKLGPDAIVTYVKGCGVLGDDRSEFESAVSAVRAAEVAIVVVGEQIGGFLASDPLRQGTVGEGADVASLDLSGVQEELIRAICATGTPTVVVLVNGRALSIRWVAEHVPAIVEAWFPGERGGDAVADVLFGDTNPSGRLSVSFPRHVGQLPIYYNHKPSRAYAINTMNGGYRDMPATPLYPFGHGLSYTRFEYANLRIEPLEIPPSGTVVISVEVTNAGERQGQEVVQLYIRDVVGSVVTPVRQLRGFDKISTEPGETKTVTFTLGPEQLQLLNRRMQWVVEPGTFEVMVGASCEDIRQKATFEVTGPPLEIGSA